MKKSLFILLLLAAAGTVYWATNMEKQPKAGAEGGDRGQARSVPVTVAEVATSRFTDRVEAIGTTRANESVTITAKVTDKISTIGFNDGESVEKGTLLVELINDEQTAQLAEAKADREEARLQLKRIEDLIEKKLVSASQLDEARARFSVADARLEGIVARLKDRVIRAPFSGVLGFRQISPGALVSPGTAITTLDDVSTLKLDFNIPEVFLGAIDLGDQIAASSPAYRSEAFQGTVASIGSRVDPITRSVTVRAVLPNEAGNLRPGMLMTVQLQTSERTALAVPEAAVVPANDSAYVYVISEDNKAERRTVATGQRSDGLIEIFDGLSEGERVVVLGLVNLRNGASVSIAAQEGL